MSAVGLENWFYVRQRQQQQQQHQQRQQQQRDYYQLPGTIYIIMYLVIRQCAA